MINATNARLKSIRFAIPESAVARHPGTILTVRELRAWSESLPFGNPPRAAQLLLQQLRLLVRDPDPGSKFSALLDAYDEPTLRLLEIVNEREAAESGFLVPLDQLEHALRDLLAELAHGRLRMANRLLNAGKAVPADLLYRAFDLLDAADDIERLHFGVGGTQHWSQLLAIYLHAADNGIDHTTIAVKQRRQGQPASITGLFFRSLVISLCDPNRHPPRQIADWQAWIARHTDDLEFGILPQGPFSIPIDISGELAPLQGARRGKPGPDTRYLIMGGFLQRLHDDEDAPKGLYATLSALIKGRKSSEQRQSPRQVRQHPFRLVVGLRAVHERLTSLTAGSTSAVGDGTAIACTQINQSKTGAAFAIEQQPSAALGIGDILLAETDNPKPGGGPIGFVGRIQRLVSDRTGRVEIGVEKMSGRLIPATLSGAAAERARGDNLALLQRNGEHGMVLIAPRNVYREDDSAVAECASGRLALRMRELVDSTPRTVLVEVVEIKSR
ncbi:MAG: hypothetical protein KDI82_10235 [Gammaproteobacteria bacterium]|nr:hypothetical protein [Gammaproteobacteria bacterium]